MQKFYCVRVYPDGSAKDTVRDVEGLRSWLEYNKTMRGGNALFVNGEYQEGTGSLSEKQRAIVSNQIKIELGTKGDILSMKLDTIGPQVDRGFSGAVIDRYTGYRPEPDRQSFKW